MGGLKRQSKADSISRGARKRYETDWESFRHAAMLTRVTAVLSTVRENADS